MNSDDKRKVLGKGLSALLPGRTSGGPVRPLVPPLSNTQISTPSAAVGAASYLSAGRCVREYVRPGRWPGVDDLD